MERFGIYSPLDAYSPPDELELIRAIGLALEGATADRSNTLEDWCYIDDLHAINEMVTLIRDVLDWRDYLAKFRAAGDEKLLEATKQHIKRALGWPDEEQPERKEEG